MKNFSVELGLGSIKGRKFAIAVPQGALTEAGWLPIRGSVKGH